MCSRAEFDFIVVVSGLAGCVLPNLLTEDGKTVVLLLEAGGRDRDLWIWILTGYLKGDGVANPKVEIRALAHRVLTEGKRAIGVEFSQDGAIRQVRARREVLLAGGAINSPQLLQLSGIGPGALLRQHGIDVVHDLPGVGENLQDHCGGRIIYRCTANVWTMNEVYHNWLRRIHHGVQYVLSMKGALMTGAAAPGRWDCSCGRGRSWHRPMCNTSSSPAVRKRPARRCTGFPAARWWRSRAGLRVAAGCASPRPIPRSRRRSSRTTSPRRRTRTRWWRG